MKTYEALNQPLKIGNLVIKNRFGVAPMTGGAMYKPEGGLTDTAIEYFVERAKGGFGLIVTGAFVADYEVDPYSIIGDSILLTPDTFKESAQRLNQEAEKYGTKIFAQITMGLGRNYPDLPAPSAMPVYENSDKLSPVLTTEQIKTKINAVIRAAKLAKEAGFAGVEVHSIHWGYLLDQFAMSFFNHREDEYGGSLENRLRAAKEIVEGIKKECGADYPVSMRLGLKSFLRDVEKGSLDGKEEVGRTIEEGVEIARLLESYGYDLLNVDTGLYDSFYYACPPCYMPKGFVVELAAAAKKAVKIPVIAGGRMNDPDIAEKAVREGKIDGVVLARASLADPEYPNKVLSGHPEKIRPCIGCNLGCVNRLLKEGKPTCCAVNPTAMREAEYSLQPMAVKKKVIVVGGGVGGMEAARAASVRGCDVELYEKTGVLGGHLLEAGAHEFKSEVAELNRWYQDELAELKVAIHLNHEISVQELQNSNADTIILATGSEPVMPKIPGIDKSFVKSSIEAIRNPKEIGNDVVIVGGGLVGCEIALDYAKNGKKVTIVEALENLLSAGMPAPTPNRQMLMESFEYYGVNIMTSNRLKEIKEGEVVVESEGKESSIKADSVVIAIGFKPGKSMFEELKATGKDVHEIGDAKEAKTIMNAIWDAYDTVYQLS